MKFCKRKADAFIVQMATVNLMNDLKTDKIFSDFKDHMEGNTINTFYIFHFLKYGYYFGIIPFKPVKILSPPANLQMNEKNLSLNTSSFKLQRSLSQTLVCITIYIGAIIWSCVKLTNSFPEGRIYASPSRILAVVSVICQMAYVLSFAYKFGLRSSQFEKLLNCNVNKSTPQVTHKEKLLAVVLSMVPFCCASFSTFVQFPKYIKRIPGCIKDSNNNTFSEFELLFLHSELCSTVEMCRYIISFVLLLCGELIYNHFQTLLLVLALSGRETCKKLALSSKSISFVDFSINSENFNWLLREMDLVQKYFRKLNIIASMLFLCFVCQLIPWTGYRLLDSMPNLHTLFLPSVELQSTEEKLGIDIGDNVWVSLYNWCVLACYAVVLYFTADAKLQVKRFQDKVIMLILKQEMNQKKYISQCTDPGPSTYVLCKYVDETLKDVCFHGGPFFHFSYRFIGTIIGIITTLILFELQFGQKESSRYLNT